MRGPIVISIFFAFIVLFFSISLVHASPPSHSNGNENSSSSDSSTVPERGSGAPDEIDDSASSTSQENSDTDFVPTPDIPADSSHGSSGDERANEASSQGVGSGEPPEEVGLDRAESVAASQAVGRIVENNTAPMVVSRYLSTKSNGLTDDYMLGSIHDLVAGSYRTLYVNGVVWDEDGATDIVQVEVKFYRSGVGSDCVSTDMDCYVVTSCALDAVNVLPSQLRYNCPVEIPYFSTSTEIGSAHAAEEWVAEVKVHDAGGGLAADNFLRKEMGSLLSVSIPSEISFGNLSLGEETGIENNYEQIITQAGNAAADLEVSMPGGLTCEIGTIPSENLRWSLEDVEYTSPIARDIDEVPRATGIGLGNMRENREMKLYWSIAVPPIGVKGRCTGTIVISTISP